MSHRERENRHPEISYGESIIAKRFTILIESRRLSSLERSLSLSLYIYIALSLSLYMYIYRSLSLSPGSGKVTRRARGSRGGQPSTTTPTPPPCDSPQVEIRKLRTVRIRLGDHSHKESRGKGPSEPSSLRTKTFKQRQRANISHRASPPLPNCFSISRLQNLARSVLCSPNFQRRTLADDFKRPKRERPRFEWQSARNASRDQQRVWLFFSRNTMKS